MYVIFVLQPTIFTPRQMCSTTMWLIFFCFVFLVKKKCHSMEFASKCVSFASFVCHVLCDNWIFHELLDSIDSWWMLTLAQPKATDNFSNKLILKVCTLHRDGETHIPIFKQTHTHTHEKNGHVNRVGTTVSRDMCDHVAIWMKLSLLSL